jgi:rod shape-determining protein MreC
MPLGTLDSNPPPFFRQGPSALSKLIFFTALAVLLMVADARFYITQPLRNVTATLLYPLQWLMLRPVVWSQSAGQYFQALDDSQSNEAAAQYKLGLQSQRALQVDELLLENTRLRALLDLRQRVNVPALAAQVLYDAADPFTRKVLIDKGALAAVQPGSPVLDEAGILGQVTRVYPMVSEVTLLTDRNQAIPVLNVRTGTRALAFGESSARPSTMELRFMDTNVDMVAGDLLTTSGVDGVYPPGLPVARVTRVERRVDSAFARIQCEPLGKVSASLHVLVLQQSPEQTSIRPEIKPDTGSVKKGGKP